MGTQILHFLIDTVAGFFCIALLARFTLQAARAPFRNPLGQFVMAVTDWMVLPARRFVPPVRGYDTATLALALAVQFANVTVATLLSLFGVDPGLHTLAGLAMLALLETVKVWLYLVTGVVLAMAVLSWVNPHAPMAGIINRIASPWLRPFQQRIPPVGGVDLSPMVLIVLIQVALMLLAGFRNLAVRVLIGA